MKLNLTFKFFITLLTAICLVVAGMFFLIQLSFDRGFLHYVNTTETERFEFLATDLETSYAKYGDWHFLRSNYMLWGTFLDKSLPDGSDMPPRPPTGVPGRIDAPHRPPALHKQGMENRPPVHDRPEAPRLFEHRIVLMDSNQHTLFGPTKPAESITTRTLEHEGQTIGFLGLIPQRSIIDNQQRQFVQEQKRTFGIIALLMSCLAALLSLPLAKQMVKRIKALAGATHQLAAGHYDTRVDTGSADELGQLTRDFNSLASTLKQNEQSRRQWVADISHELRTPLSVLRGEIEAMQDNIRSPTPEALHSLHTEVMRLNRLVDDLFQLSMSDIGALTYHKTNLDLYLLLQEVLEQFRPDLTEKNISISRKWADTEECIIFGDPDRLHQLFDNLLNNSVQYTDPGGQIDIEVIIMKNTATIFLQDSAPGVDSAETSKLFDRMYRVESSRNRSSGGAGLGLAICRNIVTAHGGTISARPSSLNGLMIEIKLPLPGDSKWIQKSS